MLIQAPPQKPRPVDLGDDGDLRRVHFTLRLWSLTGVTILITAWLSTLGLVPAILAIVTAKHVLVAILAMGLGIDARKPAPVR